MSEHAAGAGRRATPRRGTFVRSSTASSTALLGVAGLVLLVVGLTTGVDGEHEVPTGAVGAFVGVAAALALGRSRTQRMLDGPIERLAAAEIRPTSRVRSLVALTVATALFCGLFVLVTGDPLMLGVAGLASTVFGLLELRMLTRWERQHRARLVVVGEPRPGRWRPTFRQRPWAAVPRGTADALDPSAVAGSARPTPPPR